VPLSSEPFDSRPYTLLCEGVGDLRFFASLFDQRGIGKDFTVRVPVINGEVGGGRSQFGRYLSSLYLDQSFTDNVKALLVVSDNDDDPAQSFAEVKQQISLAKTFAVPAAERTVARLDSSPAVVVLMLPMGGIVGNLESLCLLAAYSKWPIKGVLDIFVSKTSPAKWPFGKQAKMRMQTILASINDKQPDTGFAGSWRQALKHQVPLDHPCFDEVVQFLTDFPALLAKES
jgi:hypothetical protein